MPNDAVAIVSDAHLGQAPPEVTEVFHRFLDAVPALAGHLVINGDLFDFWFEYRAVIPRRAFPVLSALDRVRRAGVRLTLTGGNHDRWGRDFWRHELGADFHPEGTRLPLAGRQALVTHGDGLAEQQRRARVMHRVTRWPATVALFRWLHPDLGFRLVQAMSGTLAEGTRDEAALARAAAAQAVWARTYLAEHPDVELLVLGHTHRPALEELAPGRWYLNPGAFMEGGRYALLTAAGPALHAFD